MKAMLLRLIIPCLLLGVTGCLDDASVSESLGASSIVVDEAPAPAVEVDEEEESADETPAIVVDEEEEEEQQPPVVVDPDPGVEEPPIVVDPPVQCMMKKSYVLNNEGVSTKINPYMSPLPAAVNYNYYSWSAHPIVGSTPKGYEGQFFLYEDGEGLVSFNFLFSVDAGGAKYDQVSLDISVKDNKSDDAIILSDDRMELKKLSSENGVSLYQAKMRYWKNTDGGVVGPFSGDDLSINVKLNGIGDNKEVNFYSANGEKIALSSSFEITANGEFEDCGEQIAKEEEKYACIEEEYMLKKDEIENAKWIHRYDEMLKERKEQIADLRAEQVSEYKLLNKDLLEKIRVEVSSRKEFIALSREERKSILEEYKEKLIEIRDLYKKNRKVLSAELDVRIQEVMTEEKKQVCASQKGLFGFLKKLFCKLVRFVGKVLGAMFNGLEESSMKFLRKCGLLDVHISSSSDLVKVKSVALSSMKEEYIEEVRSLREERALKLKEFKESYVKKMSEFRDNIKIMRTERISSLKSLKLEHRKVMKALVSDWSSKLKEFRKNSIKIQDAIQREFTQLVQKCL